LLLTRLLATTLLLLAGALLTALLAGLIALLLLSRFLVGILVHYVVLSNGWLEVSFDHSPAQRLR